MATPGRGWAWTPQKHPVSVKAALPAEPEAGAADQHGCKPGHRRFRRTGEPPPGWRFHACDGPGLSWDGERTRLPAVEPLNAAPDDAGYFEKKQIHCRSRVIAWSHQGRFQRGRELAAAAGGSRLLDYGCGDGGFLKQVRGAFAECWGAEVSASQVEYCRRRFAGQAGLDFCLASELSARHPAESFDVIVCMEVLEHLPTKTLDAVVADFRHLVRPGGLVLVSVPIEIGPTLAVKQVMRRLAAWRGLGDYRYMEKYAPGEFLTMFFATAATAISRPMFDAGSENPFHGHKGFNWRTLRRRLARDFTVERTTYSPLWTPGGLLSSQVWLLCRPRAAGGIAPR